MKARIKMLNCKIIYWFCKHFVNGIINSVEYDFETGVYHLEWDWI